MQTHFVQTTLSSQSKLYFMSRCLSIHSSTQACPCILFSLLNLCSIIQLKTCSKGLLMYFPAFCLKTIFAIKWLEIARQRCSGSTIFYLVLFHLLLNSGICTPTVGDRKIRMLRRIVRLSGFVLGKLLLLCLLYFLGSSLLMSYIALVFIAFAVHAFTWINLLPVVWPSV